MKLKLAVIGHRGFPGVQGGVEKHCEALMPLLAKEFEIRVYRRKPFLSQTSTETYENITYIDLPSGRHKGIEAFIHTLLCCIHIAFHRVDIVNIHNIGPGLFTPLIRLLGIKVVLTYHSPNYEHSKWNKFSKFILRVSESLALKFSNHIIFVNKFQLEKYPPKIQKKSTYIPNGIPVAKLTFSTDFLDKYQIQPNNYVLAVGRLTPEKGFDILIKAITQFTQPTTLVIAGASDHDSSYYEYLKSIDTKNRTIFTGYTTGEDLCQLYSNASIFVLSSVNEGFPLVMLEAMAYDLPLIVTDIPATHLVKLDPTQYVQPNNAGDMFRGLKQVLESGKRNVKYELSQFRWESISNSTAQIYRRLITNQS